jgi:hypothetical protein
MQGFFTVSVNRFSFLFTLPFFLGFRVLPEALFEVFPFLFPSHNGTPFPESVFTIIIALFPGLCIISGDDLSPPAERGKVTMEQVIRAWAI